MQYPVAKAIHFSISTHSVASNTIVRQFPSATPQKQNGYSGQILGMLASQKVITMPTKNQ